MTENRKKKKEIRLNGASDVVLEVSLPVRCGRKRRILNHGENVKETQSMNRDTGRIAILDGMTEGVSL